MISGFQHLAMCRFVRKKKNCRIVFQSWCNIFAFSPEIELFWFCILTSLWYLCLFFFLNFSHLIGVKCYPIVVSISNSLITNALYILIDRTPKHTLVEYQKNNKRVFKGVCTNVHSYYQCKKNIDIEVLSHRKLSDLANVVVNK